MHILQSRRNFTAPRSREGADGGPASTETSRGQERVRNVVYPEPAPCGQTALKERLARREKIEYPSSAGAAISKRVASDEADEVEACAPLMEGANPTVGVETATMLTSAAASLQKADEKGNDEAEAMSQEDVVARLPVSPQGLLYFLVETEGAAKRHESVGILLMDVERLGVQMYDRQGRLHGNRPSPGYPIRATDMETAAAGSVIKVGFKAVKLLSALREEVFRSGEFFLWSEHKQRKKEQREQEKAIAQKSEAVKVAKMTFGASMGISMNAPNFRKRPREGTTGFTVPVAGRPKTSSGVVDLKALHDHDRPGAVVLFRADYKRDANMRPIVSVVVDPIIGDKLRPHQQIGVKFLFDCVTGERTPGYYGGILADEMGLGKTIQTVATIFTCLRQGKHGVPVARKCVVVTPSSLVRNWCNEFVKWLGDGAVKCFAIAESSPKGGRVLSRFESEGDILVISYDQLRKYIDRLSTCHAVELVVCDEGHRLKNSEIKTAKAVDLLPCRRRIILSGTPIQNDLSEFHAMVNFVNPGILGSREVFGRVFEEPIMRGRDPHCEEEERSLGAERAHYLSNLTQKFILRRTQTINEKYLPAKVDCTVFCRMGEKQQESYKKISNLALSSLSSTPLVAISALKKLCNHMDLLVEASKSNSGALPSSILPPNYKTGNLDPSFGCKVSFVAAMVDCLASNGERDKLVIVSNYTQTLDVLAALLVKKRISFFQLDGSTPIKKRQELVDRFNIPTACETVFLLSSKAGGVGLNLIGANRLILFDPDWNPANDAQAMGRVWRDGQKKKVFIYRLLATGSIEERIYQRQVSKQGLSANVVDMEESSTQHFSREELRALFQFRPETACDTHDLLNCSCHCPKNLALQGVTSFRRVQQSTGPRMDELKSWQHVSNAASFQLDGVLRHVASQHPSLISFIFANERDARKLEEVGVERAFSEDEKGVICCSQVDENSISICCDSDSEE